jgi:hypothetical protein
MEDTNFAAELDTSIDIGRNNTVGVTSCVKEGFELVWEVGFIDVPCQIVKVLGIMSL